MPHLLGVHHVALTVTDLDTSLEFYERVLDLRPSAEMSDGPFIRRVLVLPGGVGLGLTQHEQGSGRSFDPTTPGLDHLGLTCGSVEELAQWAERLDRLGVSHSGVQDADYGSALNFKDPDGNALELFVPA